MATLPNHNALIDRLGGSTAVASALGIETINVRQWKRRERIPPEHWARLIELADEKDVAGVNARWLLDTMPLRKAPEPTAAAA